MNMGKMLKQMQKAQAQMLKLQEELSQKTVEATSGGGAVRAVVSGAKELVELQIDPEIFKDDDLDPEMIQDLVISAVNEALREAEKMASKEMERIAGGMGLPPGML
jgi:DNA-binding YbaB/EbfC family protein